MNVNKMSDYSNKWREHRERMTESRISKRMLNYRPGGRIGTRRPNLIGNVLIKDNSEGGGCVCVWNRSLVSSP